MSGESAEIQCVFSAMPATVKWEISTKDNKKVEVTGTTGIFGLDQTNLTISSVSPAHEGANLTCSGTNAFGSASARTKITMVYGMFIFIYINCPFFGMVDLYMKYLEFSNPGYLCNIVSTYYKYLKEQC